MTKYLFFDIDGTLLHQGSYIPESAIAALRNTRKKGNKIFICSGRSRAMLPKKVLDIGFDGIVCGGGTYISYGDKIIKQHRLSEDELRRINKWFLAKPVACFFEGNEYIFTLPLSHYGNPERLQMFLELLSAPKKIYEPDHPEEVEAAKFSGMIVPELWDYTMEMAEDIKDFMHLIIHNYPNADQHESYMKTMVNEPPHEGDDSGDGFVEFLPNGCTKAEGIKGLAKILDFPLTDAYTFGDSENDREMLTEIPNSICMGNGNEEIKKVASYVTANLLDDGIYKALKHFGL